MKKILLFAGVSLMTQINAQVLESNNFDALTVGNLGTQGGFATSGGVATDYQIVSIDGAHGNSLQITGAAAATGTKYAFITSGLATPWTNRTAGNNVLKVQTEFYTGAQAGTGAGALRSLCYDAAFTPIAGIVYDYPTKTIKGYARLSLNGGAAANYVFTLGTQTYEANTWIPVSYTYDFATGTISWTYPGGTYYVKSGVSGTSTFAMLPNVNPDEHDFVSGVATGNTIAHVSAVDSYSASAVSTDGLNLSAQSATLSKAEVSIYPNPTADFLTIKSSDKLKSVKIFDATGKKAADAKMNNNIVDVRNLTKGVYVLAIETDKDVQTLKFIKK